jgi:hypothetical protein
MACHSKTSRELVVRTWRLSCTFLSRGLVWCFWLTRVPYQEIPIIVPLNRRSVILFRGEGFPARQASGGNLIVERIGCRVEGGILCARACVCWGGGGEKWRGKYLAEQGVVGVRQPVAEGAMRPRHTCHVAHFTRATQMRRESRYRQLRSFPREMVRTRYSACSGRATWHAMTPPAAACIAGVT